MHIMQRRGWEVAESQVTPEHVMLNRRSLLAGAGAMTILPSLAARADAPVNPAFTPGRALTEEKFATTYNNYYAAACFHESPSGSSHLPRYFTYP